MSTKETAAQGLMEKLIDMDFDPDEILWIATAVLERVHDFLGTSTAGDELIDHQFVEKQVLILKAMKLLDAAMKVGVEK